MCSDEVNHLYKLSHHTVAQKISFFPLEYTWAVMWTYMYEKSILNEKHNVKRFHRKLVQHTITEPNYKI